MRKRLVPYLKGGAITAAIVLFLPFVTPRVSNGQWAVFDASTFASLGKIWNEDISNGAKLVQEYNELVKIWTTGMQMYNLGMAMAMNFSHAQKGAWITIAQMATNDLTQDKYGETILWPQMINGQPGLTPQAWATATYPITHSAFMAGQVPGNSTTLAQLATLNAMDGASVACLQNVANYHANMQLNLPSILKLAVSHLDGTAATNSNIEQLNMINGHQEQSNTEQRAQGAINACLAQQQTLANKVQRDQIADALDFQGQVHDYYATADLNWGDPVATLTTYVPQ
jgi:hypothetical protein